VCVASAEFANSDHINTLIAHNAPTLGPQEAEAAQRVLASGRIAQGPEIDSFENEFCESLGLPHGHAVALSSGSAALFLALWALDAAGSLVGCPVYACSALTNAITLAGAEPIIVDSAVDSPNIDIESLVRTGAKVAIVPHIFGFPIDLTKSKGVRIIEDGAQALGASIGSTAVGLQSEVAIFSFYATKLITSGGHGGLVTSRDRNLIDAIRDYRDFDGHRDRKPRFNFQMTEMQAAIGRVQLQRLPELLSRREKIFDRYKAAGIPMLDPYDAYWSPVRYRSVARALYPKKIIAALAENEVAAIVPVEDWELLGPMGQFPNAAAFSRSTVSLPTYPLLSDVEQDRIIAVCQELFAHQGSNTL
jgi:perosamine synthetase